MFLHTVYSWHKSYVFYGTRRNVARVHNFFYVHIFTVSVTLIPVVLPFIASLRKHILSIFTGAVQSHFPQRALLGPKHWTTWGATPCARRDLSWSATSSVMFFTLFHICMLHMLIKLRNWMWDILWRSIFSRGPRRNPFAKRQVVTLRHLPLVTSIQQYLNYFCWQDCLFYYHAEESSLEAPNNGEGILSVKDGAIN